MSKLILVDGNSLLYRTFFALPNLMTREGIPTGGIYGFTNILLKLIEEKTPDYIAFTFDLKGPTFRHLEYAQYKAQRPKAPSDLVSQISLAKELASALKIPIFEKVGYEADDCIATLTRKAIQQEIDVLILSGDLDCLQLVGERVTLLVPVRGISEIVLYDQEKVKGRFGITSEQFVDYKALIGDPSDNIPRLPGIGEKTAQRLLNKYGSIKAIYEHLEDLEPKIRQTLENCREQLEQNIRLAKLVDNLDLEVNWGDLRLKEPDQEKLLSFFQRLEFKTLLRKFAKPSHNNLEFQPLESLKKNLGPIALAIAIHSSYLALSDADGTWAGPLSEAGNSLFPSSLPSNLVDILEDEEIKKYLHDAKETRKIFRILGIDLKDVSFDLMLASYLLNSARSSHSLEQIYLERKKEPLWPEENISSLSKAVLAAEAIYTLSPILKEDLKREDLLSLLENLELPLSEVLLDMEEAGIKISVPVIEELAELAQGRIRALEEEIYSLVGSPFNISSPKQLSFVLFEKLQLAPGKKTKAGFSTDSSVLESLRGLHPVVEKIIEHRTLSKFKNTYLDTLPDLIGSDGRIHTNFLQTSTSTGRLSSVNPNLQNIPVRGEFGAQIRKTFQASSENFFLLSADYSQIELRVLAHLSGDQNLMNVFLQDGNVHTATACHIFGVKEEEVTPEMRRVAKTVNFGVIYGMSPYGLSQAIMRSTEEAQVYIKAFFEEYPGIRKFQERLLQEAKEKGYVQTILKRRRYIPDLKSANRKLAGQAERAAINAPIQGSAADIIKLAMIQISREIKERKLKSKLVLQVHDELLLDCPKEEESEIALLVRKTMSSAYPLLVPLKVDLKKGDNWFQMESISA